MSKLDWIKCSDRLPKSGTNILVSTVHKEQFVAYTFTDGKFELNSPVYLGSIYLDSKWLEIHHVTHWAELDWPEDEK